MPLYEAGITDHVRVRFIITGLTLLLALIGWLRMGWRGGYRGPFQPFVPKTIKRDSKWPVEETRACPVTSFLAGLPFIFCTYLGQQRKGVRHAIPGSDFFCLSGSWNPRVSSLLT